MGLEKFFGLGNKAKEAEKPKLKVEGLDFPPDFKGNLESSIKAVDKNSMYFGENASEELKKIVSKVRGDYYLGSILRTLDGLAKEMNWTEYKQVDINALNNRLKELLAEKRIEEVDDDNPLLKHIDTGRD